MQHLFDSGHGPKVNIPYYGQSYVCDAFLDYPSAQGWEIDWLIDWTWSDNGKSLRETHAFLQAWLFFGLIESVTGIAVCAADFTYKDESGNLQITTAGLIDYYERWRRRDYTNSKAASTLLENTTPYLKEANVIVLKLYQRFGDHSISALQYSSTTVLDPGFLLSLQLIGTALTRARDNIYGAQPCTLDDRISLRYQWGHIKLMQRHMLKLGWCPSIAAAYATKQADVQCYAATLEPPQVKKDHTRCSARKCQGNQVDEEDYQVKHVSNDCTCEEAKSPLEKVVGIIQRGGIPLLTLPKELWSHTPEEAQFVHGGELKTIEYQPGIQYVAISHVWKDGLGNPVQNSLPSCQIRRLRKIVREMYADKSERGKRHDAVMIKFQDAKNPNENVHYLDELPPIWMDTLCVPVQRELKKVRAQAIGTLADVYRQSHKVLVLDEELQQISLDKLSWKKPLTDRVEAMFRFAISSWNSRLWTLQEGLLGNDIYLLLNDGVLRTKDLFFRMSIDAHNEAIHNIHDEGLSLLTSICFHGREPGSSKELALGRMILSLRNRQTSRNSDETICLSSTIGGNPSELANTTPKYRMQKYLQSLEGIPPAALFMGEPRLCEPGFRWAPTSFLNRRDRCYDTQRYVIQKHHHPYPERPPAQLMADGSGLQIVSPGIQLASFESLPDTLKFTIDLHPTKPLRLTARYDRDPLVEEISWTQTKASQSLRIAALVVGGWALDYRDPVDCVLVAMDRSPPDRGDSIRASVVCSFQIFEVHGARGSPESGGDLAPVTRGIWYDHKQTWVLD